jgi:hypothetical protein
MGGDTSARGDTSVRGDTSARGDTSVRGSIIHFEFPCYTSDTSGCLYSQRLTQLSIVKSKVIVKVR